MKEKKTFSAGRLYEPLSCLNYKFKHVNGDKNLNSVSSWFRKKKMTDYKFIFWGSYVWPFVLALSTNMF